jgi:hypothetical protein
MQESVPSIYDTNAPRLIGRGYFPTIVGPGSKAPHRYVPSRRCYELQMGWSTRTEPILSPQPDAGIGVRCGAGLVALDYDDDEAALIISPSFPDSPVNKTGQKAWTGFYRADFSVPSEAVFDGNGNKVLEILSDGRHTVMPPSIHPDTKQPYRYTNGHALHDIPLSELPLLPRNYREIILAHGYTFGKTKVEEKPAATAEVDGDQFAEINALALANRSSWVPALGLYKCKRTVGHGGPYVAVATWRGSTTGKAPEEREPNLKIHRSGIKDFGDGRTYSPIDLVMAARGVSLADAYLWLEEHLQSKPEVKVDWDKLSADEPKAADPPKEEVKRSDDNEKPRDFSKYVGQACRFGDPLPASLPMLVPFFVPAAKVLGYLGAQWGAFKTFLIADEGVGVATGTTWAGQKVANPGFVLHIELENSEMLLRSMAAATARSVSGDLPIIFSEHMPPTIIRNGRMNNEWIDWCDGIGDYVRINAKGFGVPPRLVTLDAQNRFAGFRDEQSSAEGNVVINGLLYLIKKVNCGVQVADHLGKDASAGLRGTSVKHDGPYYILNCGETAKSDLTETRYLSVMKMKGGRIGIAAPFHMQEIDIEATQKVMNEDGEVVGTETGVHKTLTIRWHNKLVNVDQVRREEKDELTEAQEIALSVLSQLIGQQGEPLPEECEAGGLFGVPIEAWRDGVLGVENTPIARARFSRTAKILRKEGQIKMKKKWAWICLPEA